MPTNGRQEPQKSDRPWKQMTRRRILIVVNYFHPYVSGVSEYARELAKSLSLHHEVTVLTGKHLPDLPEIENFETYTLIRAKPLFFISKGYISFDFIAHFIKLSQSHDIINLQLPMLESGLLSLLTAKPLIANYHCDMATVGSALDRLAVACVRWSMRVALLRAKSIVVLSKDYSESSKSLKKYRSKITDITAPNRFQDKQVNFLGEQPRTDFICGFVGRFVEEKGIDVILDAAEILKKNPIQFLLVGDHQTVMGGSVVGKLKNKITHLGEKVQLLGKLTDEQLIEYYQSIDVLLLPSTNRFEAFGMVQLEAMYFGATVIASDIPGVREAILKTKMGHICIPGSAQSLANAILEAREARSQISRAQVHRTLNKIFKKEEFIQKHLMIIEGFSQNTKKCH